MPFGLGFNKFKLENEKRAIIDSQTAYVNPTANNNGDLPVTAEVSALSARYTFSQDPNSTDPRLLPPPRASLVKPIRDGKNIRSMRLRPRQVLCTKCKQGVHDNAVQGSTTSLATIEADVPPPSVQTGKMELRGKRKPVPEILIESPKRPRHQYLMTKAIRSSPVIKISFTSPQGEVHTSKLQPSTQLTQNIESEASPQRHSEDQSETDIDHDSYKKLKKALKKAKLRERSKATDATNSGSGSPSAVGLVSSVRHHKKSKRSKHKRKHRHRETDAPQLHQKVHSSDYLQENGSDFENDVATADYENLSEKLDAKDWDDYHVSDSTYIEGTGHLKENYLNVPRQRPINRGFQQQARQPEDQASTLVESSRISTSTGSSANSNNGSISDSNLDSDENDESEMPPAGDEFPHCQSEEQDEACLRPLMMRIQTKNVSKSVIPDGRTVTVGDVVWGKILGFPWWPGKIISITVSQRDNGTVITQMAHVAWFGSSTMSHMPCSELYPFLEDFKLRYNKKKKGPYKTAIKEATMTAQNSHSNVQNIADGQTVEGLELTVDVLGE